MKRHLYPTLFLFLFSCSSNQGSSENDNTASSVVTTEKAAIANNDSSEIANASVTFYKWYLIQIKEVSTYEVVRPNYVWIDSIPKLQTDKYFQALNDMDVTSEEFIASEKQRFQVCQASINGITYKAVEDCGCSISEFSNKCAFLDNYYWISSQEKLDGCIVQNVNIEDSQGTCSLKFYFISDGKKVINKDFSAKVHLIKHKGKWLIKEIEKRINPA